MKFIFCEYSNAKTLSRTITMENIVTLNCNDFVCYGYVLSELREIKSGSGLDSTFPEEQKKEKKKREKRKEQ